MNFLTMPLRARHVPRTLFPRTRSPRHSTNRTISTTPIRRSVLGTDRIHWSRLAELSRGPTNADIVREKLRKKLDPNRIKVYPCLIPSARAACKDPIGAVTASQLSVLDPTGARQKLFSRTNNEGAKVGDILLVRTKEGDPVSGVCLNIRRQGVDTSILLRNQVTRVGVEMWFKIFSPNVEGVEIVQKKAKRARRARLYYMRAPRKPKHDMGSVQNIVQQYQRQRQVLRSGGDSGGRESNSRKRKGKGR